MLSAMSLNNSISILRFQKLPYMEVALSLFCSCRVLYRFKFRINYMNFVYNTFFILCICF